MTSPLDAETMTAIVVEGGKGPPEALKPQQIPMPRPGPGQVLIKVRADEQSRGELMNIVNIFRGKVIDVGPQSYVIELTGNEDKINAILALLRPLGIMETVRTGRVAMFRGGRCLTTADAGEKEKVA